MTEFTPEWIAQTREQLKLVSPLPWKACSCGKCGMITGEKDLIATATRGDWGDDYPIIKPVGGSIGGQYEVVMEQITYGHLPPETGNINAQYIAEACNNYPEALDEIERLQKRIAELEIYENKNQSAKEVGIYWVQKLREEEARADLHANLNRKIANALGKKINENWSDIPEIVVQLKQRIAELESVNEDQALTISQNDYAYAVDKEMMEAEIKESNDLLRSAFMIAKRDGKETNWEAFRNQVSIALERQHKMMYPKGEK